VISDRINVIDDILESYRAVIGRDYPGYKNHVYRMVNFCFASGELNAEQQQKVAIAGSFHDIGIWTADTFDYLPPSIAAANGYLASEGLDAWCEEIGQMIDQHHKLHSAAGNGGRLVEIFRKGDLVDLSLGLVKCGLPRETIRAVKTRFPNAGFHVCLIKQACRWIPRNPLNPVPVLKW
jgi:hypothetical protein